MTKPRLKALLIPTEGDPRVTDLAEYDDNQLQELQRIVGGNIEAIRPTPETVMWVNEDGKLKALPININATNIAGCYPHDIIVGAALLTGCEDDEGYTQALGDEALAWALTLVSATITNAEGEALT